MKLSQPAIALAAYLGVTTATAVATGQTGPAVPKRQIPPSVLSELRLLENRFELALAQDCAPERCFPKGCTYGAHTVADQPRSSSLPGLSQDPGPGSVIPQEYLTHARCSFAHERSIRTRDAQALVKRLQLKLSKGWTVVEVTHEALQPIPPFLRDPPPEPETEPPAEEAETEPEAVAEEPDQALEEWELSVALRELWVSLLPHFAWMIAVVMLTIAALMLIWAWRRLGRQSPEEQALMSQLLNGGVETTPDPNETAKADGDDEHEATEHDAEAQTPSAPQLEGEEAFVAEQTATWGERLRNIEREHADAGLQELTSEMLRTGEMELLAKASLTFPQDFPRAFPDTGELATAKLALADYLKAVDPEKLPADAEFFAKLNRYALSASLAAHTDARIVRSLREEYGAAGIAQLAATLPARYGALLVALTPPDEQQEVARLLSATQLFGAAEQLLRSNRMDRKETAYLFDVLEAVRADKPLPKTPADSDVSDRGVEFDAAGALSVLLPQIDQAARASLIAAAQQRFNGALPTWTRRIVFADMLLRLADETRADVLLTVDSKGLAAWLSLLEPDTKTRLLDGMPSSLHAALSAHTTFSSRAEQLALALRGRLEISAALEQQLLRANVPFEQVVS